MAKKDAPAEKPPVTDGYKGPQAAKSYSDIADELSVNFIKAKDLSECGAFNIVGTSRRKAQGRFEAQVNFDVLFLEGDGAGAQATVSLRETPMRLRLHDKVIQYGSIGPLVLVEGKKSKEPGSNAPWVFVSPEAAAAGELPHDANASSE